MDFLRKKIKRDTIIEELHKQGVSSKPYMPSIHLFDFYKKKFKYKKGDFPISEKISDASFALPIYIGLSEEDIKDIVKKVVATIQKYEK